MPNFETFVKTNQGVSLDNKLALQGGSLELTRMVVGSGVWPGGTEPATLTALLAEELSVVVGAPEPLGDGRYKVRAVLSNIGLVTGFSWQESGVYAVDPDLGEILYMVTHVADPATADYIPAENGPNLVEMDFAFLVQSADGIEVTAVLDDTLVLATKRDVENHARFARLTALTGGGSGALDAIPWGECRDNELAVVEIAAGVLGLYRFDKNSTAAEYSPSVIKPDSAGANPGRWLLVRVEASRDVILDDGASAKARGMLGNVGTPANHDCNLITAPGTYGLNGGGQLNGPLGETPAKLKVEVRYVNGVNRISQTWRAEGTHTMHGDRQFTRYSTDGGATWSDWEGVATASDVAAAQAALGDHEARTDNPHGVTKGQVGLGNLPNAKSDAVNLDDSSTLASSRAVRIVRDAQLSTQGELDALEALIGGYEDTGQLGPAVELGSGYDLNDVINDGQYGVYSGSLNALFSPAKLFVTTRTAGDKRVFQLLMADDGNRMAFRAGRQIGGVDETWTDWKEVACLADINAVMALLTTHEARTDNPHGVTKAQVGLGNLPNAKSDSVTLDNTNYLATSRAVKLVKDAQISTQDELDAHEARTDNPHGVTKAQVGLGNIPNAKSDAVDLDSTTTLATSRAVRIVRDAQLETQGEVDALEALIGGYEDTGQLGPAVELGSGYDLNDVINDGQYGVYSGSLNALFSPAKLFVTTRTAGDKRVFQLLMADDGNRMAFRAGRQIGGVDETWTDWKEVACRADINAVMALLTTHEARTDNPHGVTKAQVGLGSVANYGIATTAEALAGAVNTKYMTPLRTREALNAGGSAPMFACRAWVNFDGAATGDMRLGFGNVSSITDEGVGQYAINFLTPMPHANYVWAINGRADSTDAGVPDNFLYGRRRDDAATTTKLSIQAGRDTLFSDWRVITVAIFC